MNITKSWLACALAVVIVAQTGCATGETKKIVIGMVAGAAVGAGVGHEFVHHGQYKQFETQDTIITSVLFAFATGAILAWHYEALEQQQVEISGRYARFRLCNPEENSALAKQLGVADNEPSYQLKPAQVGKMAISLDDNTKWVYPIFRKRFLQPERAENQVISTRYIWEILKPGSFVTRSQDPQYFVEEGEKK